MLTDIEIASAARLADIGEVAAKINIEQSSLIRYGNHMAKVERKDNAKADLILVTAINPTGAGEGKSTVSIGLADALTLRGKKTALALREPSLGPVFGIKGGATGGGYAQIAPMDDINLHFTGDLHAITSANNLLCAMIDNHIYWGNALGIKTVTFRRCMDCNDRALRNIVAGLNYNVREDGFDITAASEVMAVLCLASDERDLKYRLGEIIIGYDKDDKPLRAKDLAANEAMAILLKDAIKPNLVQTLEGTPAFVHGGPFANIAHGCNSVIATKTAMSYSDYTVTEAGFGADLGAEKFLDIKCRNASIAPKAAVLVATVRALKKSGGKGEGQSDLDALNAGMGNLLKHIENLKGVFNLPVAVAVNRFSSDTQDELNTVIAACKKAGASAVLCECWENGGRGALELADAVIELCQKNKKSMTFTYGLEDAFETKLEQICKRIYGARGVIYTDKAKKSLEKIKTVAPQALPVCVAKTQYSLSDNPNLLGRPENFDITVKDIVYRAGAGFIVAICGEILLMPGLSKTPNAQNMTINEGIIKGLF